MESLPEKKIKRLKHNQCCNCLLDSDLENSPFVSRWIFCEHTEIFQDIPFNRSDWRRHVRVSIHPSILTDTAQSRSPPSSTPLQPQPQLQHLLPSPPLSSYIIIQWMRHLPNPKIFFRVAQVYAPIVIWSVLVSTAVCLYSDLAPSSWPDISSAGYIYIFNLASFALSLLLVFRTNSSYARWWEARTVCGSLLNHVRHLARYCLSWIPPDKAELRDAIIRWDAAATASVYAYIREDMTILSDLCKGVLRDDELEFLLKSDAPPVVVGQVLSSLFAQAKLDTIQNSAVENVLNLYESAVGASERISRTCMPLAYTRHTSRFVIVFITFLPFAFWEYLGWVTIPAAGTMTFLFVGIENIGVQIEEPYRSLPLRALARHCRDTVLVMSRQRGEVDKMAKNAVMEVNMIAKMAVNTAPPTMYVEK